MGFLLLGIDSLIAGIAICPLVSPRMRLPLAALFGLADGTMFLVGAGLGLTISAAATEVLEIGMIVALGLWLLVVAAMVRPTAARWTIWVVPWALTFDNLAYGVAGEHSGSLFGNFAEQALSSTLLAFVGLSVSVALPNLIPSLERRVSPVRLAGVALLIAAGALFLVG